MKDITKAFLYILGVCMVLVIIFVRAGEKTGVSGAKQASDIINSTADGLNKIIRSATGAN